MIKQKLITNILTFLLLLFKFFATASLCVKLYLVRMRENTEQKNFEHGHFSHSAIFSV